MLCRFLPGSGDVSSTEKCRISLTGWSRAERLSLLRRSQTAAAISSVQWTKALGVEKSDTPSGINASAGSLIRIKHSALFPEAIGSPGFFLTWASVSLFLRTAARLLSCRCVSDFLFFTAAGGSSASAAGRAAGAPSAGAEAAGERDGKPSPDARPRRSAAARADNLDPYSAPSCSGVGALRSGPERGAAFAAGSSRGEKKAPAHPMPGLAKPCEI